VAIVGLLAEGLSNKEIADRAFISLQTVKWHTGIISAS
jgi:ATP/maltotriose-dependent transcriptional regulator MalT